MNHPNLKGGNLLERIDLGAYGKMSATNIEADQWKLAEPGGTVVCGSDTTMCPAWKPHGGASIGKSHARLLGPEESGSQTLCLDSGRRSDSWQGCKTF